LGKPTIPVVNGILSSPPDRDQIAPIFRSHENPPFQAERSFLAFLFGCLYQHFFHFLFKLRPGQEHAVATTGTLDPNIHPHANHFPRIGSARVGFFHLYDVPQSELFPLQHHPSRSCS
jgi:hypothetical protein